MILGHLNDAYKYSGQVRLDFSSNCYNHANLTWLKMFMAERMECIRQYPEPEPFRLEEMIADQLGISPDSVMVTNGCTEAIYLLAQLFRGYSSIIPQPTFHEYANACRVHCHIISYENNDELEHLSDDRLYWICNPNNPTGNVLMKGFMDYTIRQQQQNIFIIDQSYEFYTNAPLLVPREVIDLPHVILLHSLSKQYAVPGLRLGYITANPSIIHRLREIRQPYAVSNMAIEAGCWLVEHGTSGLPELDSYLVEADRLRNELNQITGIRIFDTKSCFMLGQIEGSTATELRHYMLQEHGILIRDCSSFTGLTNQFFRITAQTPSEDNQLIEAIKAYIV